MALKYEVTVPPSGISPAENLNLISVTPVSAYITWNKSPEMKHISVKFRISCESKDGKAHCLSTESCSALLKGLKPQTEYTVTVYSKQSGVKSIKSDIKFKTIANQERCLQDLGLFKHLNKKMSSTSMLKISRNTIYKQTCESLKDLPLYRIRKLMWCNVSSSCASVLDKKTGLTEKVNPLDLTTAIFHCSDPFLQQTLCSKMSQCQLAVPLLLPNCDTQQSTLMVWAMRDIVKTFKSYGTMEHSVATKPMPLVSFVKLGKSSLSKSSYLNRIVSPTGQSNDTFVHYNMECGDVPRKISDGLVEISWSLPSGRTHIDVFQQPVAFANLRGDIRMFETQLSFLCQTSAAVFVFTNDSEKDVSILTNNEKTSKLHMVVPECNNKDGSYSLVRRKNMSVDVIIKAEQNESEFTTTLCDKIAYIIRKQESSKSLESMTEIARKNGLLVDENCSECDKGRMLSNNILTGIKDITKFKSEVLLCQGQAWKEISSLEREKCQLKRSGREDIEHYKSHLNNEVTNRRAKQCGTELSRYITYFTEGISKKGAERNYFLKSLRMSLDRLTQEKMSELTEKFKTLQEHPEKKEEARRIKLQIPQCSLGLEHFFREVGQLYESACLSPDSQRAKQLQCLPEMCAQLLLEGYPLELLDGDASNIPLKWIEDIFNSLSNLVKHTCVISVVSVLGVQNTGKSTLLNTMFGVQFAVSSGKCTRGAFIQLLKVSDSFRRELKCDYIMIIDTEGLKSPELKDQVDSYVHDNELATLVIGLSDVTIINMSMADVTQMKDILQIAVHAFLRMKEVGKKPRCLLVHQSVGDVSAFDNNCLDKQTLIEELNGMTNAAARMEKKKDDVFFTDVMDYDPVKDTFYIPALWQGTPPMAFVSAGYSDAVYELKKALISALKDIRREKHDLFKFWQMTKDLWQAVRYENFIFNFKNSLVAEAYAKLCREWDKWEWAFQKEMYDWSLEAEVQISNCGMTDTEFKVPLLSEFMLEASEKLDVEERKILSSLQLYFDTQTSHSYLIERYKEDFKNNITSLKRTTKASIQSGLQVAIDIQNGKKRLRMIHITQSQAITDKTLDLLKSVKDRKSGVRDEVLRKEFDHMWTKTKSEFPCYELPKKDVVIDAFQILQMDLKTYPGYIQKVLIEEKLPESQEDHFQNVSETVIKAGENLIFTKAGQKADYKSEHLQELLHTINEELQKHDIGWILEKVVRRMSKNNKLLQMEKALIDGVLRNVTDVVKSFINRPSRKVRNVSEFIKHICRELKLILPDDAVQDLMIMKSEFYKRTGEFASHLKDHIESPYFKEYVLNELSLGTLQADYVETRLRSLNPKPQDILFKSLFGCGKQCPFCQAPCEAGGSEHKEHFSTIHRPEGIIGCHTGNTKVLKTAICSSNVMGNGTFSSKETGRKSKPYKEYRRFYPEWYIPADSTIEASAYWKFFMVKFNDQIAKHHGLNPAIIPDDWKALTKDDALKGLQKAFRKVTQF
ncbi:interferon-induced very large GTPase 1-like [Engraulis encrasicolus]|uniref:interferon-induced very large GTPase 1-like n=1 Tax=Engraulis encrasicolus TaxID=184585 RepID=UPI002FD13BA1